MRGTILDMIPLMVIVGVLLVGVVVGSMLYQDFRGTDALNETIVPTVDEALAVFDYGAILIVVALGIAVVISAFFINTHPIFLPISIIIFIIVTLVSGVVTNSFMAFATDDSISTHANEFGNYLLFAGILPIIVVAFGGFVIYAMYGKRGGGS